MGDRALLGALVEAEAGWVGAQADLGLVSQETAAEVVAALGAPADYPVADIAADAASVGTPSSRSWPTRGRRSPGCRAPMRFTEGSPART